MNKALMTLPNDVTNIFFNSMSTRRKKLFLTSGEIHTTIKASCFENETVNTVNSYKSFRVLIDDKLSWIENITLVCKKVHHLQCF